MESAAEMKSKRIGFPVLSNLTHWNNTNWLFQNKIGNKAIVPYTLTCFPIPSDQWFHGASPTIIHKNPSWWFSNWIYRLIHLPQWAVSLPSLSLNPTVPNMAKKEKWRSQLVKATVIATLPGRFSVSLILFCLLLVVSHFTSFPWVVWYQGMEQFFKYRVELYHAARPSTSLIRLLPVFQITLSLLIVFVLWVHQKRG